MKQIKLSTKKGTNIIEIHPKIAQTISQRDVEIIQRGVEHNFLHLSVVSKKSESLLRFDATGLLPIIDFFKMNILSKYEFLNIIRQYIHFDKYLDKNYCKKNAVLYDIKYIFIEPVSEQIYFAYVPLQPFEGEGTLRSSLQSIIQYATFDSKFDLQYVQEYISIVRNNSTFSLYILQEYLQNNEDKIVGKIDVNICKNCGFQLNNNDNVCPMCRNLAKEILLLADDVATEYTDDDNGVVTAFATNQTNQTSAYLSNSLEKIQLSHFPFRVGKQSDLVDYQIANNTISRKHAELVKEEGHYYILDLGSTNGTFINGRRLQAGVKEKINSGDKVTFSRLDYYFTIMEE